MIVEVVMPDVSQTTGGGTILSWMKKVGDLVHKGDALLEVETDKSVFSVEAYCDGLLAKTLVAAGQRVDAFVPIALITTEGDDVSSYLPAEKRVVSSEQTPKTTLMSSAYKATTAKQSAGWIKASRIAKALAREHGIDLAQVHGTGPGGRIVEADLRSIIGKRAGGRGRSPESGEMASTGLQGRLPGDTRSPLSAMRKAIGRRTQQSMKLVPHYYLSVRVDVTDLNSFRDGLAADGSGEGDWRPTYTDFILRAVALTLRDCRVLNSSLDGEDLVVHQEINLGMVVQLEDGLLIPVIRHADAKSLSQIAQETRALIEKARYGTLSAAEATGTTFSVSNMGMLGIRAFTAIINPPEVGMLAVGQATPEPAIRDGQVVSRDMMDLVLSCDHRVVDGAMAAGFLTRVKARLEAPRSLADG